MDALAAVAAAAAAVVDRPATPPLASSHQRIPLLDRHSIIALHRVGWSRVRIAQHLSISYPSVLHWIRVWRTTGECKSGKRSGRPRCTTKEQDENICITARVVKFTSPKKIKAE